MILVDEYTLPWSDGLVGNRLKKKPYILMFNVNDLVVDETLNFILLEQDKNTEICFNKILIKN